MAILRLTKFRLGADFPPNATKRLDSAELHLRKTEQVSNYRCFVKVENVPSGGPTGAYSYRSAWMGSTRLARIAHHANNLARRFTLERRSDAPPDDNPVAQWITLQPELLRQRLVDDDHRHPVVVLFSIRAVSQDQNLQAEGSGPAASGKGVV